ncbi:MAG: hypothetical protein HY543_06340 [Deltaproteobacteria bacterium]|nr:hypothetical protein [Deltaproteobacteria bacterium]
MSPSSQAPIYVGYTVSHNCSVAALDETGRVLAAVSEERFSRKKLHAGYPWLAMHYLLQHYGHRPWVVSCARLDTMRRALRTLHFQWQSMMHGRKATPLAPFLSKLKFQLTQETRPNGHGAGLVKPEVQSFIDHHACHAASAYYHGGHADAYVVTLDGVGNYYSCTISEGREGKLTRLAAYYHNDITIGNDYEVITGMLGFDPLRHPGKITGLAAYGRHNGACIDAIDAFLRGNWNGREECYYLRYLEAPDPARKQVGLDLLRAERRTRFKEFSNEDIAFAIQYLTEEKTRALLCKHIPHPAGKNIALAGGVFANVKLNQRIHEMGFATVFVQPAMDDGGLALGAPLHLLGAQGTMRPYAVPTMLLGPAYDNDRVRTALREAGLASEEHDAIEEKIAALIADKKVVARYHGAMEFGPRALGNRSILYQATDKSVNDWLNKRLGRTEFMPFAPVTLWEEADRCYQHLDGVRHTAKFMTMTVNCTDYAHRAMPAVVHVDGTARPQLITAEDNPSYYGILKAYHRLTGIPTLVNTSFNMHEEPIVESPEDAIRAFRLGRLDCLAINNFLVYHKD